MGAPCKGEVNLQELRHASDYRLDVRVRSECQNDVATLCADVSRSEVGHASGLKCFVSKFPKLSGGCQTEVYSRPSTVEKFQSWADLSMKVHLNSSSQSQFQFFL